MRKYSLPVVAKWLGNTGMVDLRDYADATDEHFGVGRAHSLLFFQRGDALATAWT